MEQDHYVQVLATLVSVTAGVIRQKLAKLTQPQAAPTEAQAVYRAEPLHAEGAAVESALMGLVTTFADTRTALQELDSQHFIRPESKQLASYLKSHPAANLEKLPEALTHAESYVKIALLQGEEGYQDWPPLDRRIEAFTLAARLQDIYLKKQRTQINLELRRAEAAGDTVRQQELLRQFRDLTRKRG